MTAYTDALNLLDSNRFLEAEHLLKKIPINHSDYFSSISTLASLAYNFGNTDKAISYLKEAKQLSPAKDNAALVGLATVYKLNGDLEKQLEILAQIVKQFPDDHTVTLMYAEELLLHERYAEAKIILDQLLELFPLESKILLLSGDVCEKMGELDEGLEYFRKAIIADKFCINAYLKIVAFNGWKKDIFDLQVFEGLVDCCTLPTKTLALVHNSLGVIYEKLGKHRKSFKHYNACNLICREQYPGTLISRPWTIEQLKNTYTSDLLGYANKERFNSPELIFIVGMPRSGSTLVEQILINSGDIETLGEFKGIGVEIESLARRINDDLTEEAFPEDCSELGKEYLDKRVDSEIISKFIIDKMPANYNYIGLMYLLFPNAKFIYTQRDPAAVCFSNWATVYVENHPYSYTFEEMVAEYNFHAEVMDFWKQALPGKIHTVAYEDTVNNFDTTILELCDFIGVEFNPAMRDFHKKKRLVNTASIGQVTKPLYRSSLNRVGKFGHSLDKLKGLLK